MSTLNRPHNAGLAATGLLWLATNVAVAQVGPTSPGPAPIHAPASTPGSTFSVLLMLNGTVVKGEITEDPQAGVYRLKCKGGQVPYPRNNVKKAAGTLEELYQYQVDGLPPHDSDERMKLVRWCLTEKLKAQAREQLAAVLAMSPDDVEANRMAKNIDANADAAGRIDPEVRQTGAEIPRIEAPAPLDSRVLQRIRTQYGNKTLPEIFDLPPAVAVSRASDFARVVHPVLQQNCAGCHNERYQGEFQLVQVKIPKDLRNPDVARANLDAALRLVNPDDPSRSELLSNGLIPHGSKKTAIFKGPNDPQYRVLSTWARSLRPAPARAGNEGVNRTGYTPANAAPAGGGFGSDRPGREAPPEAAPAPGRAPAAEEGFGAVRRGSARPYPSSDPSVGMTGTLPPELEAGASRPSYPRPFAVGGVTPNLPASPGSPTPRRAAPPLPVKNEPTEEAEPSAPDLPTGPSPSSVVVEKTDNPNQLPGMDKPLYPTPPKAESPAGKKKSKLDPALLEKMIKTRNAQP